MVTTIALSPDGAYIACGTSDSTVWVWGIVIQDVALRIPENHMYWVTSVASSPVTAHILSGPYENKARIWDVLTGDEIVEPLRPHLDRITSVTASPKGTCVVSDRRDTGISVWDALYELTLNVANRHLPQHSLGILPGSENSYIPLSLGRGRKPKDSLRQAEFLFLEDGWIVGPQGELILWIPQEFSLGLWRPTNDVSMADSIVILNLQHFTAHGPNWTECYLPGPAEIHLSSLRRSHND